MNFDLNMVFCFRLEHVNDNEGHKKKGVLAGVTVSLTMVVICCILILGWWYRKRKSRINLKGKIHISVSLVENKIKYKNLNLC